MNVFWQWFRYGAYIGNTYGSGTGPECLNNVLCDGTETSFKYCGFSITRHDNPSRDVSIQCSPGMILTVSVTILAGISIMRQHSFVDIAHSGCRFCNNRIVERMSYIVGWTREVYSGLADDWQTLGSCILESYTRMRTTGIPQNPRACSTIWLLWCPCSNNNLFSNRWKMFALTLLIWTVSTRANRRLRILMIAQLINQFFDSCCYCVVFLYSDVIYSCMILCK